MDETVTKKRIEWIDFAKGITIILVIIGHTISLRDTMSEMVIRGIIFSFHMPLFFILSIMTFKLSDNNNQFIEHTKKGFKHLIVPAIVVFSLNAFFEIVRAFPQIDWLSFLANKVNSLIYASGVNVIINVNSGIMPALGMLWFLIALFVGRTLFDGLHCNMKKNSFATLVFVSAAIGIILAKIQWLPLSFDVVLVVFPFFYFGIYLKKMNLEQNKWTILILSTILLCAALFVGWKTETGYLELATRRYPLYILGYVTGISGTLMAAVISDMACKWKSIVRPINYVGKNSLWLFCIHAVDSNYIAFWQCTSNNYINSLIRISLDIGIFCILMTAKKYIAMCMAKKG